MCQINIQVVGGGEKKMPFDLVKIGQVLQAVREEKSLSLYDVAEALFIRRRVIEAIEGGQWEKLPHEVYVKGYVTQYATFLGVLGRIEADLRTPEKKVVPLAPVISMSPSSRSGDHRQPKKKLIGTVAVAMIAGGFLVYQNMDHRTYVAPPLPRQVSQPAAPQPTIYEAAAVNTNEYAGQVDKASLEEKKLMIACQQRTWVRIVIDGLEKKEFMMNPEEVLVLDGKEGFDLLIGNAGGIKLFYNGRDTGFAGHEGEVKRISLS
jgi:hypothetical protein